MLNRNARRTRATGFMARALGTLGAATLLLTSTGWSALAGDTGFAAINLKAYQGAAAPTSAPKAALAEPPMGGHGVVQSDRDAARPIKDARTGGSGDPRGDAACKPIEDARKAGGGPGGGAACKPIEDARKAGSDDPGGDGA
jgi:hypothetical protein